MDTVRRSEVSEMNVSLNEDEEKSIHLHSTNDNNDNNENNGNNIEFKSQGHIEHIVIENFKSYNGNVVIGPFKSFTCIIGPNGSGKSNLMDATSFVLGVRTSQLRGKQLKDLIYRHSSETSQPVKRDAYVELKYVSNDGVETIFRRTIHSDGKTVNMVDGTRMSMKEYEKQLENIGVIVRARNFLVFQGDVESIAQKTPKQLTEWLEQVSGSMEYKQEHNEKLQSQEKIQNEFDNIGEKNRNLARERKQMKLQREEVEQYQQLTDDLWALKSEFYRWQLYNIGHELETARQGIEERDKTVETLNNEIMEIEEEIKTQESDISNVNLNLLKQKKKKKKK